MLRYKRWDACVFRSIILKSTYSYVILYSSHKLLIGQWLKIAVKATPTFYSVIIALTSLFFYKLIIISVYAKVE